MTNVTPGWGKKNEEEIEKGRDRGREEKGTDSQTYT